MGHCGATREQAEGRLDSIEPVVGQLIRRLIENDSHSRPATGADQIILDIEVEGVRYLAIRCAPRSARPPEPGDAGPDPNPALSPREFEIARMVAKGYANKSIASVLDISSWTVSSHLRRIYTKFGVTSRAAMVSRLLDGPSAEPPAAAPWSGRERIWPSSSHRRDLAADRDGR